MILLLSLDILIGNKVYIIIYIYIIICSNANWTNGPENPSNKTSKPDLKKKPMDFADSYIYTRPGDEFHSFSWYAP